MICQDVPDLVVKSLVRIGCDQSLIGRLDAHSPIELSFKDTPNIYLELRDDHLWMFSCVGHCRREDVRPDHAHELLQIVWESRSWIDGCGCAALGHIEDALNLEARVRDEITHDVDKFAEAVSDFFTMIGAAAAVIPQLRCGS